MNARLEQVGGRSNSLEFFPLPPALLHQHTRLSLSLRVHGVEASRLSMPISSSPTPPDPDREGSAADPDAGHALSVLAARLFPRVAAGWRLRCRVLWCCLAGCFDSRGRRIWVVPSSLSLSRCLDVDSLPTLIGGPAVGEGVPGLFAAFNGQH